MAEWNGMGEFRSPGPRSRRGGRWRARLAGAMAALLAAAGHAQDAAPRQPRPVRVIEINGTIQPDLVPRLRAALGDADPERFPAGAVVFLDSAGGDGLAAMEAGRLLREAKAHAFVRGRCHSACVYILAGGVVRGASAGAVGIHRGRLTTFVKGIGVVDINANSNPEALKALEAADRSAAAYLKEMGLPEVLFKAMMGTASDRVRVLGAAELAEFGLAGMDPAYREARSPVAAARLGMAEEGYAPRALQVQEKCVTDKVVARDFVRCYSRVLRTGE